MNIFTAVKDCSILHRHVCVMRFSRDKQEQPTTVFVRPTGIHFGNWYTNDQSVTQLEIQIYTETL